MRTLYFGPVIKDTFCVNSPMQFSNINVVCIMREVSAVAPKVHSSEQPTLVDVHSLGPL